MGYASILLVILVAGCANGNGQSAPKQAANPAPMPSYPIALTDLLKMEGGQAPQPAYSPSARYGEPSAAPTPVAVAHYTPAATPAPARYAPAATPGTARYTPSATPTPARYTPPAPTPAPLAVRPTPSPAPAGMPMRKKPVDTDTSLVP